MAEVSQKPSTRAKLGVGLVPHRNEVSGGGQNIFFQYFSWHFIDVPRGILKAWINFLRYNLNYFSVPLLLKTLFSYWRRYRWFYPRGFDIKGYIETFFSNLISRVLGAVVRMVLIIVGLLIEIFIIFGGLIILIAWLLLPILLIGGLYFGFRQIIF